MTSILIWISACILTSIFQHASSQQIHKSTENTLNICKAPYVRNIDALEKMKHCQIILGNLELNGSASTYKDVMDISLPMLTEVTGFLMIYNDAKIKSLGELFPNLARIRGQHLYKNYAISIYNMTNLEEIGLYNLVRIDRGAVAIQLNRRTCYYDTIDWKMIGNDSHIVIGRNVNEELGTVDDRFNLKTCKRNCSCSENPKLNYCWNEKKCQKFVDNRDETCHEECLGCSKSDPNKCILCRHFTNNPNCVSTCPNGTFPEETMQYCLNLHRCLFLGGVIINNTCMRECPRNYKLISEKSGRHCVPCEDCDKICRSVHITTISDIQKAGKCDHINGHLLVNIRIHWNIMNELRTHLKHIKLIRDYIVIENSNITELDFLPSLEFIQGVELFHEKYILLIRHMNYLQNLFPIDHLNNLKPGYGAVHFYDNPQLCIQDINHLGEVFNELRVPDGMNGFDMRCSDRYFSIRLWKIDYHYVEFKILREETYTYIRIIYTELFPGQEVIEVDPDDPCNTNEWHEVDVPQNMEKIYPAIYDLNPSTTYAFYIEMSNRDGIYLTRSPIYNFTTYKTRPKAPFITRAVSTSPNSITFSWLTNAILSYTIDLYFLEIILTDIKTEFVDVCVDPMLQGYILSNESLHEVDRKLPVNYERCRSKMYCNDLPISEERYYTTCATNLFAHCDHLPREPDNETLDESNYHKNYFIDIDGRLNEFKIENLAPFSVYELILRSCTENYIHCSRSSRVLIRTLPQPNADLATLTYAEFDGNSINVTWNPPEHPNGHVISYDLQIKPAESLSPHEVAPMSFCVPGDSRNTILTSLVNDTYLVRICTSSMASNITCTEWRAVFPPNSQFHGWLCVVYGIVGANYIWGATCFIQKLCFKAPPPRSSRRRRARKSESENPFLNLKPTTSKSCPAFIDVEMVTYHAQDSSVRKKNLPLSDIEEASSSGQERGSERTDAGLRSISTDQGQSSFSPENKRCGSSFEMSTLGSPSSNTGLSSIEEDETGI